jgi:hypothetical protein
MFISIRNCEQNKKTAAAAQTVCVENGRAARVRQHHEGLLERAARYATLLRSAMLHVEISQRRQVIFHAKSNKPVLFFSLNQDLHIAFCRKVNIVDLMFKMIEQYTNNLEDLVKEKTEKFEEEKKKTEKLLMEMLPK